MNNMDEDAEGYIIGQYEDFLRNVDSLRLFIVDMEREVQFLERNYIVESDKNTRRRREFR